MNLSDIIQAGYSFGTSFPTSPVAGQRFYHTDRNILYSYANMAWVPDIAYADIYLYMKSGGSDPWTSGDGAADWDELWAEIPRASAFDIFITVEDTSTTTYTDDIAFAGKSWRNMYIRGQKDVYDSGTTTGRTARTGADATFASETATDSGASWTTTGDGLKGYLFEYTSGNAAGSATPIKSNTATVCTLAGGFYWSTRDAGTWDFISTTLNVPASGNDYQIWKPYSTLGNIVSDPAAGKVYIIAINFDTITTSTPFLQLHHCTVITTNNIGATLWGVFGCYLTGGTNRQYRPVLGDTCNCDDCYLYSTGTFCISADGQGRMTCYGTSLETTGAYGLNVKKAMFCELASGGGNGALEANSASTYDIYIEPGSGIHNLSVTAHEIGSDNTASLGLGAWYS